MFYVYGKSDKKKNPVLQHVITHRIFMTTCYEVDAHTKKPNKHELAVEVETEKKCLSAEITQHILYGTLIAADSKKHTEKTLFNHPTANVADEACTQNSL